MYNYVTFCVEAAPLKTFEELVEPEELSDLLLRLAGRDEHYPAYSESRTVQRERVDVQRASQLAPLHHNPQVDAVGALRWHEIALMLEHTPLTVRQRQAVVLYLYGFTFEEMGRHWGVSKQAAHRLFLRACAAIRESWSGHPLHGLTATYRESTLRRYARRTRWLNRDEE